MSGGGKVATLTPGLPAERLGISYGESLNTCKSQIQQRGRLNKTVDNKSKEEVNAACHVKGIISKEEELDEVLQQRHTKIVVISETKKKLHATKDTRNYSTTYSGVKQNIRAQLGATLWAHIAPAKVIIKSFEMTEFCK